MIKWSIDDVHRKHRKLMNPAFSTAHMKRLIPLFNALSKQVREIMAADIKRTGRAETDVLDYMSRVALVSACLILCTRAMFNVV